MKAKDRLAWMEKNKRLNAGVELKLGQRVIDGYGLKGVVVKVIKPLEEDDESHGTIYVWQEDKTGYGADNCEHYTHTSWHAFLRLIDQ